MASPGDETLFDVDNDYRINDKVPETIKINKKDKKNKYKTRRNPETIPPTKKNKLLNKQKKLKKLFLSKKWKI